MAHTSILLNADWTLYDALQGMKEAFLAGVPKTHEALNLTEPWGDHPEVSTPWYLLGESVQKNCKQSTSINGHSARIYSRQ
jgi:hypothetical protein